MTTTGQPALGLAVVALDEESTLPHLLASVCGAFDQVILVDTGSTDRTVEVFEEWAKAQNLPLAYKLDRFEWSNDFAAARNFADSLLDTDWLCWADADEIMHGARRLREVVSDLDRQPSLFPAVEGQTVHPPEESFSRVRMVRAGVTEWAGRVHETHRTPFDVCGVHLKPSVARWEHTRPVRRLARDVEIARRWVEDEPESPRALAVLAGAELERRDFGAGCDALRRYLQLGPVRRVFGSAGLAMAHAALERLRLGDEPTQAEDAFQIVLGFPPGVWDQPGGPADAWAGAA